MKKTFVTIAASAVLILLAIYFFSPGTYYSAYISFNRIRSGLAEKSVTVDGHVIHYLEGGSGEAVVMIHGFGMGKDDWTAFSGKIIGRYRTIIPDLPGFGESSYLRNKSYSIKNQTDRLKEFTEKLGLKKFHLMGNSLGGAIAGKFTVDYPENILSLALISSSGTFSSEKSEFSRLAEKGKNMLAVEKPGDYRRYLEFMFFRAPRYPDGVMKFLGERHLMRKGINDRIYGDLRDERYLLEWELSMIKAPALILWGDSDRLLHVSGAGVLERGIPGSRAVIIKESGHMPMRERPGETARIYMEFLAGIREKETGGSSR